jgi:hypothetical protein
VGKERERLSRPGSVYKSLRGCAHFVRIVHDTSTREPAVQTVPVGVSGSTCMIEAAETHMYRQTDRQTAAGESAGSTARSSELARLRSDGVLCCRDRPGVRGSCSCSVRQRPPRR